MTIPAPSHDDSHYISFPIKSLFEPVDVLKAVLLNQSGLLEKRSHPGNSFANIIFIVMSEAQAQVIVELSFG